MKLVPVAAVIGRLNWILADGANRQNPNGLPGFVVHDEISKLVAALEFWEEALPATIATGVKKKRAPKKRKRRAAR